MQRICIEVDFTCSNYIYTRMRQQTCHIDAPFQVNWIILYNHRESATYYVTDLYLSNEYLKKMLPNYIRLIQITIVLAFVLK